MRGGTGRGRQGPGILGATPRTSREPGVEQAPPPLPEQQRVDTRQLRWLPRHQPWNASSPGALGRRDERIEALTARLDELGELREAGLLTDEEFVSQRAWLLGT